jgi:uncharacterized protein
MTRDSAPLTVAVPDGDTVPALLLRPDDARCLLVLAHGAGAGMSHPFMEALAARLAAAGVATFRYEFPYMAYRRRTPDSPAFATATVAAAAAAAAGAAPDLPLFAGGKSFGGRMTSQAQAIAPLAGVHGLAFLGFPLHPAGKPSDTRALHLGDVHLPMLFIQGTRDKLAEPLLLQALVKRLGASASLHPVEEADHSFHVLARSGRNDDDVMREVVDALATWLP